MLYCSFAMIKKVSGHEIATRGQCGTAIHVPVRECCVVLLICIILKQLFFFQSLV